jgi:penicillin V acylase-like amidase (Ntn superfamily)
MHMQANQVTYTDLVSRLLSVCGTIDCVRKEVGKLRIVNTAFAKDIATLVTGSDYAPFHMTFCDASAHCLVLEWIKKGQPPTVISLDEGVLTNEPNIFWQRSQYHMYMKKSTER